MGLLQIARLVALGVVGAMMAGLFWLAADRGHQKDRADRAARCEVAALSEAKPLTDCGPNVSARVGADRQTVLCEGALMPALRPETRFTARQACGPGTLRLIAQVDAGTAAITGLEAQLTKGRADSAAAIDRAEARGRTEQSRRDNAKQVLQAAPRGADGRVACDAGCLRQLAH